MARAEAGRARHRRDRRADRAAQAGPRGHRLQHRLDHRAAGTARALHACPSSAPCRRSSRPAPLRASKRVSVLGTEATVEREYTRALIREFANGADVTLVGSARLARYRRSRTARRAGGGRRHRGRDRAAASSTSDGRRTDTVVLACTHYPLLQQRFRQAAALAGDLARPGAGHRAARRSIARPAQARTAAASAHMVTTLGPKAAAGLRKGLVFASESRSFGADSGLT